MKLDLLKRLNSARAAREAAILVTDTASGEERLVLERQGYQRDPLAAELEARFRSGKSGPVEEASVFLTVHVPPPRLIAIGAVHISQELAPIARIAGFDMTIIDPRTAFATPERFPDVPVLAVWPDEAIPKLGLDAYTALAALTHDPKIDDAPLKAALEAGCFYVGALGSRKTHGKRLERLRAAGVSEEKLAQIRAPIGLDIGAHSPAEIAVAVMAEIIRALRLGSEAARERAA
jgi:xanthine dehydrogenase accessory factor